MRPKSSYGSNFCSISFGWNFLDLTVIFGIWLKITAKLFEFLKSFQRQNLYTYNANLFALSEEGGRTDDPRQKVYKIKELANSRDQVLRPQVGA